MLTFSLKEYEQMIPNKNNIKFFLEIKDNKEISIETERNKLVKLFITCYTMLKFTNEGIITVIVERKKIIHMINMMKSLLV